MPQTYHLAQVNIARLKAPAGDPSVQAFFDEVPAINRLAEHSPGFVWRFNGDYPDPLIAFNMSVWESKQYLLEYVFGHQHASIMRRRSEWMVNVEGPHLAAWWQLAGTVPTMAEGLAKLRLLEKRGSSPDAFTLNCEYDPPNS